MGIDNLSHLFQKIMPVHKQREVKKGFDAAFPGVKHKLQSADVLNKHRLDMEDVKVCGSVDDVPNSDTAEYDQFVMDMQKLARKQVFESSKNKKKIDGETTVKTEKDCDANAVACCPC